LCAAIQVGARDVFPLGISRNNWTFARSMVLAARDPRKEGFLANRHARTIDACPKWVAQSPFRMTGTAMANTVGAKVGGFLAQLIAILCVAAGLFLFFWFLGWFQVFGLAGGIQGEVDGNEAPVREAVEPAPSATVPDDPRWSCVYVVTYNNNWHDDVQCTRGVEQFRPDLLPNQFVTPDDMNRAAVEFEAALNG
jgi:hypothetical protein